MASWHSEIFDDVGHTYLESVAQQILILDEKLQK